MPQLPSEKPDPLPPDLAGVFDRFPQLREVCGAPLSAELRSGLTNRVYAVRANCGDFFLRLPETGSASTINRIAEAHNLALAVSLGLALPPLFCDTASGVLVTRAVDGPGQPPADLPRQVGAALGRLHSSGAAFREKLDPDEVLRTQRRALDPFPALLVQVAELSQKLAAVPVGDEAVALVPSHGDLSPGNVLPASERLWLIDWEYSAMADPAWDLAYAILEHDFDAVQERLFLEGYCAAGAARPAPARLEVMKAKCDAVSASWALEQLAAGRESEVYRPFAAARRDRALHRLDRLGASLS